MLLEIISNPIQTFLKFRCKLRQLTTVSKVCQVVDVVSKEIKLLSERLSVKSVSQYNTVCVVFTIAIV